MVKGLAHCAFVVKDMEKTIDFYEKTLGFKKAFDIPRPENGEPWIVYIHPFFDIKLLRWSLT